MSDHKVAERTPVALYVTCLVDLMRPQAAFAALRLLEDAGYAVSVPAEQSCCGQPGYNGGDYAGAAALARRTITQLEAFEYIVLPSGSCTGMLRRHYPKLLEGDWGRRAEQMATRVYELSEFLVDVAGYQPREANSPRQVAYHDACAGLREIGVRSQPRQLLAGAGVEVQELSQGEVCCGFGGTFCARMPAISAKMADDKLNDIEASGASEVVAGDVGCLMALAGRARRTQSPLEFRHFAELLTGEEPAAGIGADPAQREQLMEQRSHVFLDAAEAALESVERTRYRDALGVVLPRKRSEAVDAFGDFETLRKTVHAVRRHALDHLDHYLEQFVASATENGCQVHFARDGAELNASVLDICARHGAERVAKGKSMVTEETGLNAALEEAGLTVRETDLGEYIIQEAGETPSHITAPALHKTVAEIRELFLETHDLGERDLEQPADMVREARQVLRGDFIAADVGIIGSNALIAESGESLLVTNEGNGDLCANLPPVLIVCTTLERILPRRRDALAMLRLLARSSTAQQISSYSSFYAAPRRERDVDGPLAMHFVLLDNRRSDILASDYSEMLQCVRCGACLNHCPVYVAAGGHAYGWVYPGPMGSILTPLLTSLEDSHQLPHACTGCGRCEEVCPSMIPLPDLLRDLRAESFTHRVTARRWRLGLRMHSWIARRPAIYRAACGTALLLMNLLGRRRGVITRLPLAGGWLEARDLPTPPASSFQEQFRQRGADDV